VRGDSADQPGSLFICDPQMDGWMDGWMDVLID